MKTGFLTKQLSVAHEYIRSEISNFIQLDVERYSFSIAEDQTIANIGVVKHGL